MATISTDILTRARELAHNLRQEGRDDDASTVDILLQAADKAEDTFQYLTTGEVGRRLGVSRQTIVNWIKNGVLPGARLGGRLMVPEKVMARFTRLEKILDDLDAEREPGKPDEIIALVGRGREHWTWQRKDE